MTTEPKKQQVKPFVRKSLLMQMRQENVISQNVLDKSLQLIFPKPNYQNWQNFVSYLLLALGTAFLLSGIIFFFAFNWAVIGKFTKLGIIQAAMIICLIASNRYWDTTLGRVMLLASAIMVGVFLAVFGQIYQTGADAYEFFLGWSLLISGWVIIGKFAGLWFLEILLLNLAVSFYWDQVISGHNFFTNNFLIVHILFGINFLALVGWETASHFTKKDWLQVRWFPQILAVACLILETGMVMYCIVEDRAKPVLPGSLYLLIILLIFVYCQKVVHDLYLLTMGCISLITLITTFFVIEVKIRDIHHFLFLSIFVIFQVGIAVTWLGKVSKSWKD